ncbi:MAG: nucleotidyltransferase domain-containing protein [Cetobacterium sp.]
MDRDQVLDRTIMLFEYGSRAHGTNTEFSDSDFMGLAIEPREFVIGLDSWEQLQTSTSGTGERSMSGDTDTTIYSLRKWARLAAKGNPTVMTALYAPEYSMFVNPFAQTVLDCSSLFVSREAGFRYLGYMQSQRDALTGMRNKRTNRPELVHTHGYDTKFGFHMIRLGMQGVELMRTGKIQLPMIEDHTSYLLAIRNGEVPKEDLLRQSYEVEYRLRDAIESSTLPDRTDKSAINRLVISLYQSYWNQND